MTRYEEAYEYATKRGSIRLHRRLFKAHAFAGFVVGCDWTDAEGNMLSLDTLWSDFQELVEQ